ncbi:hypothetical protein ACFQFC_04665 [Amorphoplanes digitatis]|uniref:Uncharacterized protein n=1 Tax=Actinoplanes digitatis TaxID=1868 RepID=A0A7W7HZ63_9ACTN|nr:hypothetical protein [Actinoplanes digitatis]MBB4763480.1 hypothetical protein [Actinoplanes digitatis]GID92297.1 hypothetical protein Adi01nite_17090 [Actinoplanes digitatis]
MRRLDEHDLRFVLREEAERHRPDRGAMLDRIARGRAEREPALRDRLVALLRPAAAALAVAVVLMLGIAGVRLADGGGPDGAPVAAPTPVAPTGPAPATTPAAPPRASTSSGTATKTKKPPPAQPGRDGFLSSAGTVDPNTTDYWAQGTVVIENTRTLTALEVTVNVAMTPGLAEAGRFSTVAGNLLTATSSRKDDLLVFRFTLVKGAVLAPGRYTFAVQFNHAPGRRSAAGDTYSAEATAGGRDAQVTGVFTAG